MDVLDHDHRIVDHQADRHGEPAHRHQVDRFAEQPHQEESGEHRERQGTGGHQCQADVAQEHEQHQHREEAADHDGVARVANRRLDKRGEVVGLGQRQPGGQGLGDPRERLFDALPDGEDVGAQLLRDGDRRGVAALTDNQLRAIRRAGNDRRQVAHAKRRSALDHRRCLSDVVDAGPES